MADNVVLNSGSGGQTCATDDVSGVQYQVVKLADGTADSSTRIVAGGGVEASALRVTIASDSTGVVSVDDNGGSLTIDAPVGTPAFVRLSDGSAAIATLPVSAASLPLPSGAATAAKQPALGTAGTASTDVITIQGIASGTVVPVSDGGGSITVDGSLSVSGVVPGTSATSLGKAEDSVAADGDTGVMMLAVRKDTAATTVGADGDYHPLEVDANGKLHVNAGNVVIGSGTITTVSAVTAISNALPAGTNNIGDVDVTSQPARAATTDTITAKLATDTIQNGTTALTPKFVAIAASSSGNNTLLAAVSSKKIRVLAYNLMGAGAVNAKFQSGASGTDLTGLKYIAAAGGGICAPFNPVGWFETASNTLLNLNLSGAVAVGGEIVYVEV